MRSHHAPTRFLLERFTFKDRHARNGRSIWVYEKGRSPRTSRDLASESTEHGYFAGAATGENEHEIDSRFNEEYEMPFNRLLPAIDSNLSVFESSEVRQICARFVAHLFHRSKARRDGGYQLLSEMAANYQDIATNPERLRAYTAKLSVLTRRSISISEVGAALLRISADCSTGKSKQTLYVNDIDRATGTLAAELSSLRWSTIRSDSSDRFFISDTPVISKAIDALGRVSYGVGIRQPIAEWFMPISHHRCLRIGHKIRASQSATQAEVGDLNGGQIVTMSSRLYGREWSKRIDDLVQVYAGLYRFHQDVFKAVSGGIREDAFDEVMASL
jgi:hypothetical protein